MGWGSVVAVAEAVGGAAGGPLADGGKGAAEVAPGLLGSRVRAPGAKRGTSSSAPGEGQSGSLWAGGAGPSAGSPPPTPPPLQLK